MPHLRNAGLDRLLATCVRSRLIEGYDRRDGYVLISLDSDRHELRDVDAELFLRGILKYTPWARLPDPDGDGAVH